jgi:molecular chaperone HscC
MEPQQGTVVVPDEVGIGIDFGMTYSGGAVAFRGPGGVMNLDMLPIRGVTSDPKFPTVVFVSRDKRTLAVGSEAHIQDVPGKVYELFKRWLGVDWKDPDALVPDATFLVAEVLKAIKSDVDDYLSAQGFQGSHTKKRYVFSYPGTWQPGQVHAFKKAIAAAGFPDSPMVDEAIATAIGAAKRGLHPEILGKQEIVFVCDFGGGTTDFALIQATETGLVRMPHAVGGNPLLGMSNLDKVIALLVARKLNMLQPSGMRVLNDHTVLGVDLETAWKEFDVSAAWKSDLLARGEAFKRSAFAAWQGFASNTLRAPDGQWVELTKADAQPFVSKMLETLASNAQTYLHEVATRSGIAASQIRFVLVGGGGSALPDVGKTLHALMPSAKVLRIGSMIATSLVQSGAAFYALNPKVYDRRVALSYGVRTARKEIPSWHVPAEQIEQGEDDNGAKIPYYPHYEIFLKRNDVIRSEPVKRNFTPIRSNQSSVTFDVLCGENEDPTLNTRIGTLTLPLPPKAPRNHPIECSFTIGQDGLLEVAAVDKTTGKRIHKAFQWKVDLLQE